MIGELGEKEFNSVFSNTPVTVSVQPATSIAEVDKVYTTSITISNVNNMGAAEITLAYNPAVIEITQIALGEFPGSTGRNVIATTPIFSSTAGIVMFGYYSSGATPPGPDGNGEVFVITYRALAEGDSPLTLANTQVADITGRSLSPLTLQPGEVHVRVFSRVFLPLVIR